jgi:hypothetical protein
MPSGVKTVIYPVKDLDRAKSIFGILLGAEPTVDAPYYVQFEIGDQRLGLDPDGHARGFADSHDLIRVQGARENNLKDVSVEIPKRRLTVFTGVSGSGKSSLVFGTIAAESQRLINETYSAFVQGFMPTLARPDVDVLDGLTTAIIVDQERMGANARSTVGTATDANAMLRILFSRLGSRTSARRTRSRSTSRR